MITWQSANPGGGGDLQHVHVKKGAFFDLCSSFFMKTSPRSSMGQSLNRLTYLNIWD